MIFRRGGLRIRVAAVLIKEEKILLIAHKKKKNVYWLLPGGGVRLGESLKHALEREIKEELGISITVNELLLVNDSIDYNGQRHILNLCFSCSYRDGEYRLGSERRLYSYRFFNKKEILGLTIFPPVNNELVKVINGNRIDEIYQEMRWIPL